MTQKTVLLVGTYDTKETELRYLEAIIHEQGASVLTCDVSVLGEPATPTDFSKHDVAEAGESSIEALIALHSEALAFEVMTRGAAELTSRLFAEGKFDAFLSMGGTMGTDLALDCAQVLPMGVPKYVISTVSFSPIIPAHRLAPDIQMILWAGGLYGLNEVCRASLSQAAGAVVGSVNAVRRPSFAAPVIGMTSLGASCLRYMKHLKPALETRGFEVAIFHSQGMGGMAFERLASEGRFCCVMDFCVQEFVNMMAGSMISSGPARMTSAGAAGIPQMIAPGALDLVDFAGWQEIPVGFADRPMHVHNQLITSAGFTTEEQIRSLEEMVLRLEAAKGPVTMFLPTGGVQEWDRVGNETHDPESLARVMAAAREIFENRVPLSIVDAHINDAGFADAVLEQFDAWVADGTVTCPDISNG